MRKYVIGLIAVLFVLSSAKAVELPQNEYNIPENGVEIDENMYDAPDNPLYDPTEGIQLRFGPDGGGFPDDPNKPVPVQGGLLLMLGFAGIYMAYTKYRKKK